MRTSFALILALMLAVIPHVDARASDKAEAEYQAARKAWFVLKEDAARRKFRHNWQNVAGRFEQVAKRYPKSPRAADALYTAAEMQRELSRISALESDLRQAIANYERLIAEHPKNTLADDAALALALIHMERLGDPQKARSVVEHALTSLPRGDMHRKLVALQKELPAAPAPRPTGKAVASRAQRTAPTAASPAAPPPQAPSTASRPAAPSEDAREANPNVARSATTATANAATTPSATPTANGTASAGSGSTAPSAKQPEGNTPAILDAIARATRPNEAAATGTSPGDVAQNPSAPSSAPATENAAQNTAVAAATPSPAPAAPVRDPDPKEAKAKLGPALSGKEAEVTLAEQLGLKVRRVVIDAGHGGHDTGAIGKAGTREKDVTLAIAKRVGEILTDAGLEVLLTRDDDTFVRLEDRTRIANEAKGDLFISIHCNAAENRKVRGTETFTLNVASDRYSIRLAARENAASEQSMSDLQFILADLTTKAHTEESERLARRVQSAMVSSLQPKYPGTVDLGTKQALFYVLLGARMPAILVETAFLSHPEEEKRLASKAYQEELAQAIAQGVQGFLEDRSRVAQVH